MYLKLDTKFNPFTYDELVKPLVDYGKVYKEVEDTYSTLAAQTEAFKDVVNQETSREAYDLYNSYSKDLNTAMEDFSKGMTASNRRKLLEMKRRYAGEIGAIVIADKALKEANAFRDKLGPDAIFEVDRYTSLDDLLHGKVANNKYIAASQVASSALNKASSVVGSMYNDLLTKGASPKEAITAIQNSNELKAIYAEELNSHNTGIYDSVGQNKISNAIKNGINAAMGKLVEGEIMNAVQRDASARAWAQIRETQRMHDVEMGEKGYTRDSNGNFVKKKTSTYTPVELKGNPYNIDVINELYGTKKEHDEYAKFFDKNGNLTKAGLEKYKNLQDVPTVASTTGITYETKVKSNFAKYIDNIAGKQNLTKEEIEKAYKENSKRFESIGDVNYDVIRNTAFHTAFRDNSHIESFIKGVPNSNKLPTYKYTKDGYTQSDDININDDKFKNAVYSGEYGPKGNFVVITTNKGEKYKVPLIAVHPSLDASIKYTFAGIENLYLKKDKDTMIPYSDEELNRLLEDKEKGIYTTRKDLINSRLNAASDNYIAAFEEVQTEPYKVTGGVH